MIDNYVIDKIVSLPDPEKGGDNIFYGDIVKIRDIISNEEYTIGLENYFNRYFMNEIQIKLLNKSINETICNNSFYYKIVSFSK